ncbi:peptidoglycan-binding domain-containing protein [Xanthomonas fragariae]|uniref:peptidoglycan-binding domain-containing protein n=1 Tax=Xanthomonas fragariae TaxID=48664 RepID=UPI003D1877E0
METTGIYDQPTERGVQAFQLLHGMHAVDGIANPGTRAAVHKTQRRWKNARRCIRSAPLRRRAISR